MNFFIDCSDILLICLPGSPQNGDAYEVGADDSGKVQRQSKIPTYQAVHNQLAAGALVKKAALFL